MKFFASIFTAGIVFSSFAYGKMIYEDFQGYNVGSYGTGFVYFTDSSAFAHPPSVQEPVEGAGLNAAYFNINKNDWNGNQLFNPGDWIYFETTNLTDTASVAQWFQSHLAFVPNQAVADANPGNPSLVNEVWWYAYADTSGDGDYDRFFESRATAAGDAGSPLNSHDTLQAYPRRYFEDAVWNEYNPQALDEFGNYLSVATDSMVPTDVLESLALVGIQIRTTYFNTAEETDYFSVWVDNFAVIPEPTMLMLLLAGSSIVFLSSGRRGARQG